MLFVASLVGIFLVLFTMFHSVNLSLQVMAALPMAFIGAVAALVAHAADADGRRDGRLHRLGRHRVAKWHSAAESLSAPREYEGEGWTKEMIVRGGLERLAPVLMTALTAGIALVPLTLAAGEPGKEILYPVATVIVGGLISSTLLDFFVHPALFWTMGLGVGTARRGSGRAAHSA